MANSLSPIFSVHFSPRSFFLIVSFFRIIRFKYRSSKSSQGSFYDHFSDRICRIFDVTFQDKKGNFHHISIRGLFNEEKMDTIFYVSSDDELWILFAKRIKYVSEAMTWPHWNAPTLNSMWPVRSNKEVRCFPQNVNNVIIKGNRIEGNKILKSTNMIDVTSRNK